jgi:hypothetical protein
MKALHLAFVSLAFLASCRSSGGERRLQLEIVQHKPCTPKPTRSERIRFSASKDPLSSDPDRGEGCYSLSGPVTVRKAIHGTVQIYVKAKSGPKPESPIESCNGADATNCGGVGSCVYCDLCQSIDAVKKTTSDAVRITNAGKQLDCQNGVNAGNYSDISISFCMPSKEEFLKAEGIDEDVWNNSNSAGGHMFFMTMYVFNKEINTLSNEELQKIAVDDGDQVIGCHKLVCKLIEA